MLPDERAQREPLSQFGYSAGAYELAWDVIADPIEDNPNRSFIWLMRTASYLRSDAPRPEWRSRLDAYYAKHRDHVRDRMALHLLGQMDQATVWAGIKGEGDRPECTYFFGLKAQLDGDVAQAIDWYRATLEGGRGNSGEVQWASDALVAVRDEYKSIALLTEEAKVK